MGILALVAVGLFFLLLAAQSVFDYFAAKRFKKSKTGLLQEAVKRGDADAVTNFLSDGAEVDRLSPVTLGGGGGLTALHHAAGGGLTEIVRLLLGQGASVDAESAAGRTSLFSAVENGHAGTVDLLLEHGARVTARGRIPVLYPAAKMRNERLVRMLLARGADPDDPFEHKDVGGDGTCPSVVKQLVKETLEGAVPRTCSCCLSVSRGVLRDFVAYRSVSEPGPIGVVSSTITTSRVIDTRSFFVCAKCVEARSKVIEAMSESQKPAEWKGKRAEDVLLEDLARRWVGTISSGSNVGFASAEQFFRWAEISRLRWKHGIP